MDFGLGRSKLLRMEKLPLGTVSLSVCLWLTENSAMKGQQVALGSTKSL